MRERSHFVPTVWEKRKSEKEVSHRRRFYFCSHAVRGGTTVGFGNLELLGRLYRHIILGGV